MNNTKEHLLQSDQLSIHSIHSCPGSVQTPVSLYECVVGWWTALTGLPLSPCRGTSSPWGGRGSASPPAATSTSARSVDLRACRWFLGKRTVDTQSAIVAVATRLTVANRTYLKLWRHRTAAEQRRSRWIYRWRSSSLQRSSGLQLPAQSQSCNTNRVFESAALMSSAQTPSPPRFHTDNS